ncbi:MAG: hypothetical protein QF903_06145 [Planctomycetota bacterium]|jgi:hypothetical protein|nr:hypothetical protein [Planctomycetota bacterium]MDP6989041.1 hypothetical protein [Planctomycetota bacterium]
MLGRDATGARADRGSRNSNGGVRLPAAALLCAAAALLWWWAVGWGAGRGGEFVGPLGGDPPSRESTEIGVAARVPSDGGRRDQAQARRIVRVTDEAGEPIPGATVEVRVGGRVISSGTTGGEGAWIEAAPPGAPAPMTVWATASGFLPGRREVEAWPDAGVEIALATEGVIAGRVTLRDGRAVGEPLRVVAIRTGRLPTRENIASVMESGEEGGTVLTDESGAFRLGGLSFPGHYDLVVGGAGTLRPKVERYVATNGRFITLHVTTLYGVILSLREPDGSPLRVNDHLFMMGIGRPVFDIFGIEWVSGAPASAVLAGVDRALIERRDLGERLFLFAGDGWGEEIGPITFATTYPGYEPFEATLTARRLDAGFAREELTVEPTAAGFGIVDIVIDGWKCERFPPFVASIFGEAVLWLEPEAPGPPMQFSVSGFGAGEPVRVEGVPYGTYLACLRDAGRSFTRGPREERELVDSLQPLVVGPAPAVLRVDRSLRGSVEVHVHPGELASQTTHLTLGTSPASYTRPRRFRRIENFEKPPYIISGLLPGRHFLLIQAPFSKGLEKDDPSLVFEIRGGECTFLEVVEE